MSHYRDPETRPEGELTEEQSGDVSGGHFEPPDPC